MGRPVSGQAHAVTGCVGLLHFPAIEPCLQPLCVRLPSPSPCCLSHLLVRYTWPQERHGQCEDAHVAGNRDLAKASLPDTGSTLKIVQRMRLEDSQLDGVARKMETKSEHCMLLALPNGS